jgi:DNA-binding response OmpR family regulator
VSAKTSEEDVRRGFEVGVDDYVKKPFDVETLKKTVRTLLKVTPIK